MKPILTFGVNPSERISFLRRENFIAPYAPFAIWRTPYTEARQIKVPRQVSRGQDSLELADGIGFD
jgi:hypothetical protein